MLGCARADPGWYYLARCALPEDGGPGGWYLRDAEDAGRLDFMGALKPVAFRAANMEIYHRQDEVDGRAAYFSIAMEMVTGFSDRDAIDAAPWWHAADVMPRRFLMGPVRDARRWAVSQQMQWPPECVTGGIMRAECYWKRVDTVPPRLLVCPCNKDRLCGRAIDTKETPVETTTAPDPAGTETTQTGSEASEASEAQPARVFNNGLTPGHDKTGAPLQAGYVGHCQACGFPFSKQQKRPICQSTVACKKRLGDGTYTGGASSPESTPPAPAGESPQPESTPPGGASAIPGPAPVPGPRPAGRNRREPVPTPRPPAGRKGSRLARAAELAERDHAAITTGEDAEAAQLRQEAEQAQADAA